MQFEIPCDTVARLAHVPKILRETEHEYLKSIYIEYHEGKAFAVVGNFIVGAIEYLGETSAENGSIMLTVDEQLVNQCKTEAAFGSVLTIEMNEMLKFASAKTTMGYNYPGNAAIIHEGETLFENWRNWLPDEMPKKSANPLHMEEGSLTNLLLSAPSASVVFPQHIDANIPVLVRDVNESKWIGLFMPTYVKGGEVIDLEPADIPDWIK